MMTFFYKGIDFEAESYEAAEVYVAERYGYCDHDELFFEEA